MTEELEHVSYRRECSRETAQQHYKHEADQSCTQAESYRTRENDFKLKEGRCRLDARKKFVTQSGEALAQTAEKLWMPIPGGAQGQVGWGPRQPELVGRNPSQSRQVGTR